MTDFDDIRPYNDTEIHEVLIRIINDDECLSLILRLRFPRLSCYLSFILKPLLRYFLARQIKNIYSVEAFQTHIGRYVKQMINSTTDGFTVGGLDQLDLSRAYLFMSNHRDITLDPAFTNYALHISGNDTVRIAIGDNLLSKPFATDLMRANKSFIVKRSLKGPREILKALKNYRLISVTLLKMIIKQFG